MSDFAIRWLLNNGIVTSVIGGPRTLQQWNAYVRAAGREFTAEDEAFVDTLVAPGHQATHGYTWPRYPVRGRRAIEG